MDYKESFVDHKQIFNIIMEYCEEGDLYRKIREKQSEEIPETRVLDWTSQILISLEYLHAKKVIHRDLKTQNIFLSRGRLFLGDFGISKRLDNTQDLTNTYIGTPYYMSPELFNYQAYSFKSDLWSLGCVIYEICNKNHAFNAQTINGLAVKILKGDHNPMNENYSQGLRDLIVSLLKVDQDARPSLEEILKMEMFRPWVLKHFDAMMELESLTYDKLVSIDEQLRRLVSKGVFEEDSASVRAVFQKVDNRREILLKEKHLDTIISESQKDAKSEYSNNFEIEFDESISSCLSQNLEEGFNRSDLSYKTEGVKENLNFQNKGGRGLQGNKGAFEKKGKGVEETVEEGREQHFDESFEKDSSFEEFKTKEANETQAGGGQVNLEFERLVTQKIDSLKQKLEFLLGPEKFQEVLFLYQNYEESDINFKNNVQSRFL